MSMPKLIFKYKSLNTADELLYAIDIIKNQRLYFPNRTVLNDPLEGKAVGFSPGYAGCWQYTTYDEEDPTLGKIMNQYRILSLSEDGFSPQLWAHYGGIYSGICFVFKTNASFSTIKPVQYIEEQKTFDPQRNLAKRQYADHFLYKHIGWAYEKEWRITKQQQEPFFYFDLDELVSIVVGYRIKDEILEVIQKYLPGNIPVLKAFPGFHTFCVKMEPQGYQRRYEGMSDGAIYSTEELLEYIETTKTKRP